MSFYSYVKVVLTGNTDAGLYNVSVSSSQDSTTTDPLGAAELVNDSTTTVTLSRNGSVTKTFSCAPGSTTTVALSSNGLVQTNTMLSTLFGGGFSSTNKCMMLSELTGSTIVYDATGGTPTSAGLVPLLGCVSPICTIQALSDSSYSVASANSAALVDESEMEGDVNLGGILESCDFVYSVESNDSWLTVSDKGATDFTVEADAQEADAAARSGTLTVTRIGNGDSKTCTITQAAGAPSIQYRGSVRFTTNQAYKSGNGTAYKALTTSAFSIPAGKSGYIEIQSGALTYSINGGTGGGQSIVYIGIGTSTGATSLVSTYTVANTTYGTTSGTSGGFKINFSSSTSTRSFYIIGEAYNAGSTSVTRVASIKGTSTSYYAYLYY